MFQGLLQKAYSLSLHCIRKRCPHDASYFCYSFFKGQNEEFEASELETTTKTFYVAFIKLQIYIYFILSITSMPLI